MATAYRIEGAKEMAARFRQMGQEATNELEYKMEEAALLVEQSAKQNISRHNRTGSLEESITHRFKDVGTEHVSVGVGSNLDYAAFPEFGTSKMRGHFYLYFGLKDNEREVRNMVAEAVHNAMKV